MIKKTAMQELIEYLDPIHSSINDKAKQLLEKEKKQITDAMMYALDEDGHTGDWKIKFVETYYNQMFNS